MVQFNHSYMLIKNLGNRVFSEYCEYTVAFKLQELGWKVFQPLSDRYIDIVACKTIENNTIFRTIQVKGSRIEHEGEKPSYGLTHEPKDLLHDPSHYFIWIFFDNNENPIFIILSVSNFIDIIGKGLKTKSWRIGFDRLHYSINLSKTKLTSYINNWDNLLKGGNQEMAELCINSQEIDDIWKSNESSLIWKENNDKIKKQLVPNILIKIRRKTEFF